MMAVEACMKALAEKLGAKNVDEWAFAGLMHDGDYYEGVPVEKMGIEIVDIMKKDGVQVPETVAQAMAAHNWHNTGVEPKSLMDWSIFCCDSLTGLIIACALVLPDKKLSEVTVEKVLKKFKQPSFAAGTRREEIALCEEKLSIPLSEFIQICLTAMQNVSSELGL